MLTNLLGRVWTNKAWVNYGSTVSGSSYLVLIWQVGCKGIFSLQLRQFIGGAWSGWCGLGGVENRLIHKCSREGQGKGVIHL